LHGYGFDTLADRVVRFNNHADGTYMNTRATYSINGKQFTHYDLRQAAIDLVDDSSVTIDIDTETWIKRAIVVLMILTVLALIGQCSVNVQFDIIEPTTTSETT
jgi:hypothetical protein